MTRDFVFLNFIFLSLLFLLLIILDLILIKQFKHDELILKFRFTKLLYLVLRV